MGAKNTTVVIELVNIGWPNFKKLFYRKLQNTKLNLHHENVSDWKWQIASKN